MPVLIFPAMLLACICMWALVNVDSNRTIMAGVKRRWRRYLIRRGGEHAAQVLASRLVRSAAKKHIDPHVVNAVLAARRHEIVERLGRRYADEVLGKPTPLESNF